MTGQAASIRNSAKAIVVRGGKILAIQKRDGDGPWYLLPGGGQHPEETLHAALQRECLEEANVHVHVGELRFIRDYISDHHEFAATEPRCHQIEFMFLCSIPEGEVAETGACPDIGQECVKWIELADLLSHRLYPLKVRAALQNSESTAFPVYLGDVN
jgi:8-oxo-dGTP diphosphatase